MKATKTIILVILSMICIVPVMVYGADETQIQINNEIYEWEETSELNVEKINNTGVKVTVDSTKSNNTFNYCALSSMFDNAYSQTAVYNSTYGGIELELDNIGKSAFYLNISLVDSDGNQFVMSNDSSVMFEMNGEKEICMTENNAVLIADNFKGKLIIPLYMLTNSDNNKLNFNYTKLTSWTVGILLSGKVTAAFNINSINWISTDFINIYDKSFSSYIEGDDTVQLPEHGESIAFYKIKSNNGDTYKFTNSDYSDGISINDDGKLVLNTNASAQDIVIKAMDYQGVYIKKSINLKTSWRSENDKFIFYGPEELESVTYAFDDVDKKDVSNIRITILAGCGIAFLSYIIFYTKSKLEKEKEEDE